MVQHKNNKQEMEAAKAIPVTLHYYQKKAEKQWIIQSILLVDAVYEELDEAGC